MSLSSDKRMSGDVYPSSGMHTFIKVSQETSVTGVRIVLVNVRSPFLEVCA